MTTTPVTDVPVQFDPPLAEPLTTGLYPVTRWSEATGPSRFLLAGVQMSVHNYGGEHAFGVWGAGWCGDPGSEVKGGERPDWPDPFDPITVWAYDQCDLSAPSRGEVQARAAQNMRLLEPVAVEREFAARLLADAATPTVAADLVAALALLETELAKTNTIGLIHASPVWRTYAARDHLLIGPDGGLRTPGGHLWVFGGGYAADGLDTTLVATSPTYGWRDEVALRETYDTDELNTYTVIAERNVLIGYEHLIAAAEVRRERRRVSGHGARRRSGGLAAGRTAPAASCHTVLTPTERNSPCQRPDSTAPDGQERQRLATSVHEAGHAVASVASAVASPAVVFDTETAVSYHGRKPACWARPSTRRCPRATCRRSPTPGRGPRRGSSRATDPRPATCSVSSTRPAISTTRRCVPAVSHSEGVLVVPLLERCWPSVLAVATQASPRTSRPDTRTSAPRSA